MNTKIRLERFDEDALKKIWEVGFRQELPEWAKWNGPYFEDYESYSSFQQFKDSPDCGFLRSENCRCIFAGETPIGMVSRYWKDEKTRWMEIGIVIYDDRCWHVGCGTEALSLWTSMTFETFDFLRHLGLTTWSGNRRMMRVAEKLGFLKEAQIRKVRYWQGIYYDSVKYGILREEWSERGSLRK